MLIAGWCLYAYVRENQHLLLNPVSFDNIDHLSDKEGVILQKDCCHWCCQCLDLHTDIA